MKTPETPVTKKKPVVKKVPKTNAEIDAAAASNSLSLGGYYQNASGVYVDSTTGPITNTEDITRGYIFNPPLINSAGVGSLPSSLFPGPNLQQKGYLFMDPDLTSISESLTIGDGTTGRTPLQFSKSSQKHGFRFLYNPPEISMAVGFAAGVDVKMLANNLDTISNPIVPQAGSNIQVELWINRIEDLAVGSALSPGMYPSGSGVTTQQITAIRKRGTMADYDQLMLCLNSGMTLPTKYRGNTADIGWLIGGPVVFKFGKSLVYQCLVENVSVNHVRFTPNMIPSLTSLQISMSRYVDSLESAGGQSYAGNSGTQRSSGRGD